MSDLVDKAYQATPDATLRDQIMNPNFPKNEREWWAADRIEALEAENARLREALGNISRMKVFPDAATNQTTLAAAIGIARAALQKEERNDR